MTEEDLYELATALAQCREEARHWYAVASGQRVLEEEEIDATLEKYKKYVRSINEWTHD